MKKPFEIVCRSDQADLFMSVQVNGIPVYIFKTQPGFHFVMGISEEYLEPILEKDALSALQSDNRINGLLFAGRAVLDDKGKVSSWPSIDNLSAISSAAAEKLLLGIDKFGAWRSFREFLFTTVEYKAENNPQQPLDRQLPFDYHWLVGKANKKTTHPCGAFEEGTSVFVIPGSKTLPVYSNSVYADIASKIYAEEYGLELVPRDIDCLGCFFNGFGKEVGPTVVLGGLLNSQWPVSFYDCSHSGCSDGTHFYLDDGDAEFTLSGCLKINVFPIWYEKKWWQIIGVPLEKNDLTPWRKK